MHDKMNAFMAEVVEPVRQDLTYLFWKCLLGVLLIAALYGMYRFISPKPRRDY
jgi:hypothetical protein